MKQTTWNNLNFLGFMLSIFGMFMSIMILNFFFTIGFALFFILFVIIKGLNGEKKECGNG